MDCRDARPLISAYMDNELTPQELRAMQSHVAGCAECAALLASYRSLRATIRSLPQPLPPPALREAVFARATPAYRRRALLWEFGQHGLAAAAMLVVMLAAIFTFSVVTGRDMGRFDPVRVAGPPDLSPRVVGVEPPGTTDGWDTNRPLRITFSAPMQREATQAAVRFVLDPPLTPEEEALLRATMAWEGDDRTLVIGGQGALQPDTEYRIWLEPSLALDRDGRALQGEVARLHVRTVPATVQAEPAATAGTAAVAQAPTYPATPVATPAQVSPTPATATSAPAALAPTTAPTAPSPTSEPPAVMASQPVPSAPPGPPPATPTPTTAHVEQPGPVAAAPPATPTPPPATATPAPTAPPVPPPPTAPPTATPAPPFAVTGEFGRVYDANATVQAGLGLPTADAVPLPAAALQFEHGLMYRRGDTRTIYVLFADQPVVWYSFADTWAEGSPTGGSAGPQAGQYIPKRGFGKVWRERAEVQQRLGYAVAPDEVGYTGLLQPFQNGLLLSLQSQGRWVYALYADGTYERYPDEAR